MKKANKIRKIATRLIAGVALIALVIVNVQVSTNGKNLSDMSFSDLSIGLFTPAAYATVGGVECGEACFEICGPWGPRSCMSTICIGGSAHCLRQ